MTSARRAPSPGSGATPGRARKGAGAGRGPRPKGPGSDVPASVLPLPGGCGAGGEAFSSSRCGRSWGYFCGCSAGSGPDCGSPQMSEKTAGVKTPLPPWQSSGLRRQRGQPYSVGSSCCRQHPEDGAGNSPSSFQVLAGHAGRRQRAHATLAAMEATSAGRGLTLAQSLPSPEPPRPWDLGRQRPRCSRSKAPAAPGWHLR